MTYLTKISYICHIYVPFNSGEICFADKQALWSDPDEQLLSLRVTRGMPLHAIVVEGGNQLQGLIFCWSLTNTLQCLMPQTNTIKTWKTALLLHKTIWITSFFFLLHSEEELVLFGGRTNAILTENIHFPVFLLVDGVMAGLLTIDLWVAVFGCVLVVIS